MLISRYLLRRLGIVGATMVVAMLLSPMATLGLQPTLPDGPSPAEGPAEVIAQGVAALPDQAAWRVVRDTAEPLETAVPEERALGFALADQDAIVVNDLTYGTQARLAAGEASFVAAGAIQQRAAPGQSDVDYFRIALVAADEASDAGGDELLYASDAFTPPGGGRDIDLVRNVLTPDEEDEISAGEAPSLVLVTGGEITVEQGGNEVLVLDGGEAGTIDGDATLVASGPQTAQFVIGTVGPEVPPIPRFTGSVTIQVDACPAGMTPETLDASGCDPIGAGDLFAVNLLDANGTAAADPTVSDGELTWPSIPFGAYTIDVSELPAAFNRFLVTDADGVATADLTVSIDRQAPDATRVLFVFPPEAGQGSITLQVRGCPEGMTSENLVGDVCDLAPDGYAVQITESATGDVLTLDDASEDGGTFTFSGLDVGAGTYVVSETRLPPNYDAYLIVGPMPEPSSSTYSVVLTEDAPEAEVAIYNFLTQDSIATPGAQPTATDVGTGDQTPTVEATVAGEQTPTAGATETGVTGSVTAQVFLCPEGSSPRDYDASACTLANGNYAISLYEPDGSGLTGDDANGDANTVTWTDLPPGDYFVQITGFPSGYGSAVAADASTASNNPNAYLATVSADNADAGLAFYLFPTA